MLPSYTILRFHNVKESILLWILLGLPRTRRQLSRLTKSAHFLHIHETQLVYSLADLYVDETARLHRVSYIIALD
ncbi:hypothetical protein EJ110_NYTH43553 [Nymphaea thermarum]|nr:hypothetical protein EJ110_NYTH43553 [Nymphaea thermarum]